MPAKIRTGDLITLEGQYHMRCMTSYYYQTNSSDENETIGNLEDQQKYGVAFTELIA